MRLLDIPLREDDRLLLLWLPAPEEVEQLAARVPHGLLVGLGERDAVYEARRGSSHLENVMFVEGSTEEIPWRNEMFTVVAGIGESCPEIRRVLTQGGALYLRAEDGAIAPSPY